MRPFRSNAGLSECRFSLYLPDGLFPPTFGIVHRGESSPKKGGLAAHAVPPGAAGERRHEEISRSSRPDFKRDRDRLIHAKAFLYLDRKSELFLDAEGEAAPSRLLYAVEAASSARIVAELLHLNEEVTEAAVVARALGQPAFGRAGTETLARLMASHGGLDPEAQSLRIADDLEAKYPEFNGLNLSQAVRASLQGGEGGGPVPLEAAAAAWAGRISALCLDLDWGLEAGLLDEAALADCALWREVAEPTAQRYTKLETGRRRNYNLRNLISLLTEELARASASTAEGEVRVGYEQPMEDEFAVLERLASRAVRHAPACEAVYRDRAACLETLFALYVHRPHLLGEGHSFRLKKDGVHRIVADFLAQRGDRELLRLRRELTGSEASPARPAGRTEQSLLL